MSQPDFDQPRMGEQDFDRSVTTEFRGNGGTVGGFFSSIDLLLLTTTGARSGRVYTTPLAYATDGGRFVIAASHEGSPSNPAWYHNLRAHPVTTVEIGHERFRARAVITQGVERDRLFSKIVERVPGIGDMQRRTARRIPVVALERAD